MQYLSWAITLVVIFALTFLLRRWKQVEIKRWGYLGLLFIFLVHVTRYNRPTRDGFFFVCDLLLLALGVFLLAINVERIRRSPE